LKPLTLLAEIGCPECGRLIARVQCHPRLSVEHRLPMGIAERGDRHVEVRPWNSSDVTDGGWQIWACGCGVVTCGGMFVLETQRVRQLAERANICGGPIRWRPTGAEVQRSDRLRPEVNTYLHYLPGAESAEELTRLKESEPPPLVQVRRISGASEINRRIGRSR
jgi:hypothetical protein